MKKLSLGLDDLSLHVVTFGIDVYPAVDIPNQQTRLNLFWEEARHQWPHLFEELHSSNEVFNISKKFRKHPDMAGPSVPINTFIVTNRGPVFVFPLMLPDPGGVTGLEETYMQEFQEIRDLLFRALPDRQIMRIGLVRDLMFATGQMPCFDVLTSQRSFSGAELAGGTSRFKYRDAKCNLTIELEPGQITKTTQIPVGASVTEHQAYGLRVRLDVNNIKPRPLEDADMEEVLERATSVWPDKLLQYICERTPL